MYFDTFVSNLENNCWTFLKCFFCNCFKMTLDSFVNEINVLPTKAWLECEHWKMFRTWALWKSCFSAIIWIFLSSSKVSKIRFFFSCISQWDNFLATFGKHVKSQKFFEKIYFFKFRQSDVWHDIWRLFLIEPLFELSGFDLSIKAFISKQK